MGLIGELQIPARDLVDKINNMVITLWVYIDNADNAYCGIFTDEEKHAEDINPSMIGGYWEKVQFTLKDLLWKEMGDDNDVQSD